MVKIFFTLFAIVPMAAFSQLSSKGDSLFFSGNWASAISAYENALSRDTADAVALLRLGFSYHNVGDYRKAIANYQKASLGNMNPPFQQSLHSRWSRSHAMLNNKVESLKHLSLAVDQGYSNFFEMDTLCDFALIRNTPEFDSLRQRAKGKAFPCLVNPRHREFDFWVGEWDVYRTGTNAKVGHSRIEVASGGCMILENWTALGVPNTGKSMNFIDPETNQWTQIWAGSSGGPNYVGKFTQGEYRDGAMRFVFEQRGPAGEKQIGRFIFFNEGADQVRQFNEVSSDGGKTWNVVYDFTYKRIKKN